MNNFSTMNSLFVQKAKKINIENTSDGLAIFYICSASMSSFFNSL